MSEFDRQEIEDYLKSNEISYDGSIDWYGFLKDCLAEIDRLNAEYVQMVRDYAKVRAWGYQQGLEDALEIIEVYPVNDGQPPTPLDKVTMGLELADAIQDLMDAPKTGEQTNETPPDQDSRRKGDER